MLTGILHCERGDCYRRHLFFAIVKTIEVMKNGYNNIMGFEILYRTEVLILKSKNQEAWTGFVNKYYQKHHSSPTINNVAEGIGVTRSTTHPPFRS